MDYSEEYDTNCTNRNKRNTESGGLTINKQNEAPPSGGASCDR